MSADPPVARDRAAYIAECEKRWDGRPLVNAKANWNLFEEHHADIVAILEPYLRDCWLKDLAGVCHNPEGALTGWLWKCSNAPENSWIWDICDHYQTAHLSRGLIAYCKMVIAEIKAANADPHAGHAEINLDYDMPACPPPAGYKIDGVVIPYDVYHAHREAVRRGEATWEQIVNV